MQTDATRTCELLVGLRDVTVLAASGRLALHGGPAALAAGLLAIRKLALPKPRLMFCRPSSVSRPVWRSTSSTPSSRSRRFIWPETLD